MGIKRAAMLKPGDKINRLFLTKVSHTDGRSRRHFLCKCDCGSEKVIQASLISSGNTKSCGCLSRENHDRRQKEAQRTKQSAKTAIHLGYKRHAVDRGFCFELSKNELIDISQNDCYYCGSKPMNLKKTKNDKIGLLYNGIDRINNKEGYSEENCVPCCKICNNAKSDMPLEEFISWITRAYKHIKRQHEE